MRLSRIARAQRGSDRALPATMRSRAPARAGALALALGAAGLLAAAPAQASLPSASTGSARQVSFTTATLTGTVNPHGEVTSYFFQYGPTKAYGLQSAVAGAGAGTHGVSVRLAVGGLQPDTHYHFRLIAVNASG